MDLSKQLTGFIRELEAKGRSGFTITAYKKDIEQLISFLNKLKIKTWEQANAQALERYTNFLKQESDYTLKTISRKINSLKTFYKYLVSRKYITRDYSANVTHPKIEKEIPRVLSPLEYKALRDTARENLRLFTIIETLLQTGMKIGELSRLKTKEVDLKNEIIKISEFSSYPSREIPINPILRISLENYISKEKGKSEYFFSAKTGNKLLIRNIRSSIDAAFRKTGIKDATVNDLRNTFIYKQLESGMKLETLSKIVGHKKVTSTENYLEYIDSRPRKTTKKIAPL